MDVSDSTAIIRMIKEEIESYEKSRARGKKLIFERSTPSLLDALGRFLDDFFTDYAKDKEDLDIDEFIHKFYSSLGWKK